MLFKQIKQKYSISHSSMKDLSKWWPVLLQIVFAVAIASAYQAAMIPEKLGLLLVVSGYIAMILYLTKK